MEGGTWYYTVYTSSVWSMDAFMMRPSFGFRRCSLSPEGAATLPMPELALSTGKDGLASD